MIWTKTDEAAASSASIVATAMVVPHLLILKSRCAVMFHNMATGSSPKCDTMTVAFVTWIPRYLY